MELEEDIKELISDIENHVIPLVRTGYNSGIPNYYKGVEQGLLGIIMKLKVILKEHENE